MRSITSLLRQQIHHLQKKEQAYKIFRLAWLLFLFVIWIWAKLLTLAVLFNFSVKNITLWFLPLFLRLYFIFTKGLRQMEFNPSFERLDVVNDNISLIQNTNGLTYGTDALLLASYMRQTNGIGLELGSGSGIISLLAATRGKCKHIWAAEVQKEYAQLTRRNVALNHLEEKISVIEADIRQTEKLGEVGSYDVVFTNPPYMTADSGRACDNDLKNRARHELCGTVADFICTASRMLKYGGCFYIVLRPDRMTDFFVACRGADLEPKRLTAVFARPLLAPSMFLAECKRGARSGLIFTRPLLLSNEEDMDYIMQNGSMPSGF